MLVRFTFPVQQAANISTGTIIVLQIVQSMEMAEVFTFY